MTVASSLDRLLAADAALQETSGLPLGVGDLAPLVVGTVEALDARDWWVPGPRERAGAVLRGVAVARMGDGTGGARPYRVAPVSAAPALRALHAVGLALSAPAAAAVVHLGSGALADGALSEALGLAALQGARVVFVIAWRDLRGAPVALQGAATPEGLAGAHRVPVTVVDGSDADAVRDAVAAARARPGPTLVQAVLPARPTQPPPGS